jgi:hypothetical protein
MVHLFLLFDRYQEITDTLPSNNELEWHVDLKNCLSTQPSFFHQEFQYTGGYVQHF